MSRLIQATVMAAVGVLIFASLLVPVISDAMIDNGDPVTLNNTPITDNFNYEKWNGEAITFSFAGGTYDVSVMPTKYLINGENSELVFNNVAQRILFASDKVCLRVAGGANTACTVDLQYYGYDGRIQAPEFSLVVDNGGDFTLTLYPSGLNPTIITGKINWLVYATPSGTMNILQLSTPSSPFYTSNASNIIVLGNVYTTGDNDTFYSYFNGDLTVNDEYADISSVTITKTLIDGYTDVYDTTLVVNVGEESFTPYYILAPKTVSGHATSGALYDMLGVLPIVVLVALLFGVLGVAVYQRIE